MNGTAPPSSTMAKQPSSLPIILSTAQTKSIVVNGHVQPKLPILRPHGVVVLESLTGALLEFEQKNLGIDETLWARIHEHLTGQNQASKATFASCASQHHVVYRTDSDANHSWFARLVFYESQPCKPSTQSHPLHPVHPFKIFVKTYQIRSRIEEQRTKR